MSKKSIVSDWRVEVTPHTSAFVGGNTDAVARSICDGIRESIRRHVDNVEMVSVIFTRKDVCSFCGYAWEAGEPACCDKAFDEWKLAEDATHEART